MECDQRKHLLVKIIGGDFNSSRSLNVVYERQQKEMLIVDVRHKNHYILHILRLASQPHVIESLRQKHSVL